MHVRTSFSTTRKWLVTYWQKLIMGIDQSNSLLLLKSGEKHIVSKLLLPHMIYLHSNAPTWKLLWQINYRGLNSSFNPLSEGSACSLSPPLSSLFLFAQSSTREPVNRLFKLWLNTWLTYDNFIQYIPANHFLETNTVKIITLSVYQGSNEGMNSKLKIKVYIADVCLFAW